MKARIRERIEQQTASPKAVKGRRSAPPAERTLCIAALLPATASAVCRQAALLARKWALPSEVVYFLECGGYVKIAYSRGATVTAQSSSPHEQLIVARLPGGRALERRLQHLFEPHQHKGAWFRLEGALEEFLSAVRGREFKYPQHRPLRMAVERQSLVSML